MIKFDFNAKNPKVITELRLALQKVFNDPAFMRSIAKETRRLIYGRTKSGGGVSADNRPPQSTRETKLKPLSINYINQRNGIVIFQAKNPDGTVQQVSFAIDKPRLGSLGSPSRSNLTFTGQMLDSISFRASKTGFRMYFKPARRDEDGSPDVLTNEQVAEFVSKQGRPFFALTNKEYRILTEFINRGIRLRIRKFL